MCRMPDWAGPPVAPKPPAKVVSVAFNMAGMGPAQVELDEGETTLIVTIGGHAYRVPIEEAVSVWLTEMYRI